jgi:hypothetical protein
MIEIEEFLIARGAAELNHPGGTLLAHLRRTHDTLAGWGARPAMRLAGLAHAAYGTDGFPHGLAELAERPAVASLIGEEAEEIVYRYGSCDRGFSYPRLVGSGPPRLRDRFTGKESEPRVQHIRDLVELTFANELDVMTHSEELRDEHGDGLRRLCIAWRPYASEPAYAAFTRCFGDQ